MAERKSEAWLTSALDDDDVTTAMVLAGSLRRTRTTRTIAVICASSVTKEKHVALNTAFDGVFCIDDYSNCENDLSNDGDEIHAKIHAISLCLFEKCLYVSPNALVLENVDYLFDDDANFKTLGKGEDDPINSSFYMFQPRKKVWQVLSKCEAQHGIVVTMRLLRTWLVKQSDEEMSLGKFPNDILAQFSTTNGLLLIDKTHAPIIQLIAGSKNGLKFYERMRSLSDKEIGVREKLIVGKWLEIFQQNVDPVLTSPMTSPCAISLDCGDDDDLDYKYGSEAIAIIGMSCRYPGANNVAEFWNMLYEGREGVREPPAFRWTKEHTLGVTTQERKTNAGFLSTKVDEFDAKFFGVSPKEAAHMDPQARLLHEVMWESLEDSGIDPLSLYGTHTGIFTGSWMNDYKDIVQCSAERDFFRTYMGNSIGAKAARLSFLLGLTGPSIATESGCSSAMVALDLAVKSLRSGVTKLAMACGVNLLLHPFTSNIMDSVIAPNGRCKTFDAKADGFGRAEGCGVLVLKRMSDALRDRDNIWAVIRGSAVSQEGLSKSLGTPTVHCEALAMQLALKDASISPHQVSFVETHGTGTSVGDPLEVAAITKAYHSPLRTTPLVIGSVKTNVGHTESCSGITGIIKTVLALQNQLIPKHLNLDSMNPEIFLDSIPAMIPMEPVPWPKIKGKPRIAGVSSFGITGTDGHVILQQAPDCELPKFVLGQERPKHLLKISGKSSEALDELLLKYENLFLEKAENNKNEPFSDAAFSANVGRASFNHRVFIVAQNYQDAAQALQQKKYLQSEVKEGKNQQICFLFTGQGSQYYGMAKSLYDNSPIFRIHFDTCDRTLKEMYNLSIREILWGSEPSSKELSRTIYSQTSIFCVEYCLLRLWQSWGIQPDFVLGHSLGEFCAAVAAGVLDFQDALKLVAERSRLIDNLSRGSMLVIKTGKLEVDKLMKSAGIALEYAAVNYPEQTVVAGDTEKVQQLLVYLKSQKVKAIILEATHAFHSRHMDPMLEKYRQVAETVKYKQGNGRVQYVSGTEGRIIGDFSELTADYWVRHTREKVSFIDACAAVREAGCQDFLEIGPQPVLSSFVMVNNEGPSLNCMPSLRRGTDDWATILNSLGKLYLLGYKVDWKGYDEPYTRNKVSLPFHPFHKKPFWVESTNSNVTLIHPLIGHAMNNASALNIFQNDLTLKSVPYMKDHCIGNRIVFPGAGYAEMCLSAGYCVANGLTENLDQPRRAMRLENVRIDAPLELKEGKSCRFQIIVDLPDSPVKPHNTVQEATHKPGFQVNIYHQNRSLEESEKWVPHASALFIPVASIKDSLKEWVPGRIAQIMSSTEEKTPEFFYKRVGEAGLRFGDTFQMIQRFWAIKQENLKVSTDEIVAEIKIPSDFHKYLLHPLIIDSVFQSGILTRHRYEECKLKVPVRIGALTMLEQAPNVISKDNPGTITLFVHVFYKSEKYHGFICNTDHKPIALIEDVELLDTNVRTIESVLEQQSSSIPDAWEEVWKALPSPFASAVKIANVDSVLTETDFLERIRQVGETSQDEVDTHNETKRLLYLYMLNAFMELGWEPLLNQEVDVNSLCLALQIRPECHKLVRFYFTVFEEEGILVKSKNTELWNVSSQPPSNNQINLQVASLVASLKNSKYPIVIGVYQHLAKNLSKVLNGKESALTLLFPTDEGQQMFSAENYYQNHPARTQLLNTSGVVGKAVMNKIFDLNIHASGKIYRVLEVGSGTGSGSLKTLELLSKAWGDRFEFYYTDISLSFFVKAEKKLEQYKENVKYAVFNIEQSPLSQGIPLNYFDIVCATDVVHATRNLDESLTHLRQTLRPSGYLIFTETVIPARDITFVFGLLDGYWRFEDRDTRSHHCCVGEGTWEKVLNRCGFQSVNSFKAHMDEFACITAVACPHVRTDSLPPRLEGHESKKEWVIFATDKHLETIQQVAYTLEASGFKVVIILRSQDNQFGSIELRKSVAVKIIQPDEEDPSEIESILGDDDSEGRVDGIIYAWGMDVREQDQRKLALPFLHIAKCLVNQRKPPILYILTCGVHPVTEDVMTVNPTSATLYGMAKSLKNENFSLFVRLIDLDEGATTSTLVDQILFELTRNKGVKEQHRVQVAYRNNGRWEPRMVKASLPTPSDELKLPHSTDRYHLVLPKSKVIQDLEFEPLESEPVEEKEIEVKVTAYALNFRDIFAILKPSEEFDKINVVGLDFAGVVTKVGSFPNSGGLQVGDRVFGANNFKEDQLPSHIVLDADSVLQIPEKMTDWEAATLPAVFSTAYYCLITIAKLKIGDTVLIHTGSGGVGLAAIQLAKHIGANIITTAGNPRKRAYLKSLGIQHVFHSRNTSFEQDILRVTSGRGVDVVLNSITGPGIKEATLNAAARNARFVEMSKLSTWTPDEVQAMRPDVDYKIIDLTVLHPEEWAKLMACLKNYLLEGSLKSLPYVKFDALNIRQALQYFQKAKHIGKVVCTMPDVGVQGGQYQATVPMFNSQSTYLITGGLGGIGFEVCKWMLGLGATDIMLTGRSPPKPEVAAQIQELNDKGANVMVMFGDIGDLAHCKAMINEIEMNHKPLRGVMHCAGILQDNLYTNQTWDAFEATFAPKVTGTWNLHKLTVNLPLEHFILYSSVTAMVGTPGQPNHAAANCFEDALVYYRHSLGLPGTTINWGQWSQVGCAKEINISGVLPVSMKRMLNGMKMALKTQKRQIAFCEFESLVKFSMMCPLIKSYMDDRIWKQLSTAPSSGQGVKADQFWKDMDGVDTKNEKLSVMSVYLKALLRTALRLEPDEPINDDANIQELGVDSLMTIELKNSIQSLLGSKVNVTAAMLKNCNTVKLIANAVVSTLLEEEDNEDEAPLEPLLPQDLIELLRKDSVLEESIQPTSQCTPKPSQIKTILVTGVTGQLAPYIISEVLKSYKFVDKIVCLVRDSMDKESAAEEKLKVHFTTLKLDQMINMSLVDCVVGNVALPNMGLPEDKYKSLCDSVDAVIHCAAKTTYSEHYRPSDNDKHKDIRSVNVGGTLNVLKFASTSKTKHVYYPSTSVCGFLFDNNAETLSDCWPTVSALQTFVDNKVPGFQTSKFVCELLLKQACDRGIPCKVFRFPWIGGESVTGRIDYLKNLYILRYLSFLKVQAIPEQVVPANVLPVDTCAKLSLHLFFRDDTPFEIFNIGHPAPQVEQELREMFKQEFGRDLKIVGPKEFMTLLEEDDTEINSLKSLYKDQRQMSMHMMNTLAFAKGYLLSPDTFFTNRKLVEYLPTYGQDIPSSSDIVRRDLQYVKSTGFFDKFGLNK